MVDSVREERPIRQITTAVCLIALIVALASPLLAQQGDTPGKLYNEASDQFQRENYQRALEHYRDFVQTFPNHDRYWDARFGVGQSLFKLNKFRDANQAFALVRKNHPSKEVRGDGLFGQIQIAILEDNVAVAKALSKTFLNIHDNHILRSTVKRQLGLLNEMNVENEEASSDTEDVRSKKNVAETSPSDSPSTGASDVQTESPEQQVPTRPTSSGEHILPELRFDADETVTTSKNQSPDTRGEEEGRNWRNVADTRKQTIKQLRSQLSESREENTELKKRVASLEKNVRRLENQLARKLTDLSRDTEIHTLSREINLPDTASEVLQSSLDELRNRAREALENDEFERAREINNRVLERNPRPADYHFASKISSALGQSARSIEHLDKAISLADSPALKHIAGLAELLLEQGEHKHLDELIEEYGDYVMTGKDSPESARWYYVTGKYHITKNQTDKAFFLLMKAIRTSPDSEWANEAQKLIQDEL